MKTPRLNRLLRTRNLVALTLGLLAFGLQPQAQADDRDLFRTGSSSPYLFILFDTTGSMQWLTGANDSACGPSNVGGLELGTGDPACTAPGIDDNPLSRLYQLKSAIYTVLDTSTGVSWGFGTFPDLDGMRVDQVSTWDDPDTPAVEAYPYVRIDMPFNAGSGSYCSGIEPNNDTSADDYSNYNLLHTTGTTATGLEIGDIIPLDWGNNNKELIKGRLAPNLVVDPTDTTPPPVETVPDFGIGRYFKTAAESNGYHHLKEEYQRPFLAQGRTPLAESLRDFKSWFDGWRVIAETSSDPTVPGAPANDQSFKDGCREVSVVLVTDGVESCESTNAAENVAQSLFNPSTGSGDPKIRTYVIGFATTNPKLDDIAEKGGSPPRCDTDGDGTNDDCFAYLATDETQLVGAFQEIIGSIQSRARTFASAAVPSVIGSASENVYLTSFSPTEDAVSLWPGRVDAYVKPVPLTTGAEPVPDRAEVCDATTTESCLAWDGAEMIRAAAPTQSDVDGGTWKVGTGATNRRIFWGIGDANGMPEARQWFRPPSASETALEQPFYGPDGFGFDPLDPDFASDGEEVVKYFLKQKYATITDPLDVSNEITIPFVMGDIFHSDPVVLAEPTRFDYFGKDLEGQTETCGTSNNSKARYPCFVKNTLGRRRVLFVGSNEGALHAFDAGSASRPAGSSTLEYSTGTGQELFAYVPRSVMPSIRSMKEGGGQQFTVDGPVTVDDVLRDPSYTSNDPVAADREWRTVLIGGLREGGNSYYALDVTQPDKIDELPSGTGLPIADPNGPGCVEVDTDCDHAYPTVMWELDDTWVDPAPAPMTETIKFSDEDGNGRPDLGRTWSKVNTGRIKIDDGMSGTKDVYVAIFGGGMDPDFKNGSETEPSGNFLYMVDIETGKIIYKRPLNVTNYDTGTTVHAMAPSEPAAVDTDQDSYIDTIYIGTTAGYLYKVDLRVPVEIESGASIDDYSGVNPLTGSAPAVRTLDRITDPLWDPFPIFNTGGRPMYHPPSVIFAPELSQYALAFGTGDREDLWSDSTTQGRFYVILDDGFVLDTVGTNPVPLTEANYQNYEATNPAGPGLTADFLGDPPTGKRAGYVLELDEDERVIAKSLGLSGVVFFSTYVPAATGGEIDQCASAGSSRLYAVFASNGMGINPNANERFRDVGDFVTQPFVESSGAAKGKPADESVAAPGAGACSDSAFDDIRTALKAQMPAECSFAQYSLDVMTLQSDSGVECVVPIPVCVIQRNWKEF